MDDIIAEGDKIAFEDFAPNRRRVTIQEVAIFRVVRGKIVEQWGAPDVHGLVEQFSAPNPEKRQSP